MVFRTKKESGSEEKAGRVPPGQRGVDGWPVLTYGLVPKIDLATWQFRIWGEVVEEVTFTWEEFMALPKTTLTADAHCVTGWSKLENAWEGVAFREVMKHVRLKPGAEYPMVHSYGDYTTNVPLADLDDDDVLFAYKHGGEDLTPDHVQGRDLRTRRGTIGHLACRGRPRLSGPLRCRGGGRGGVGLGPRRCLESLALPHARRSLEAGTVLLASVRDECL